MRYADAPQSVDAGSGGWQGHFRTTDRAQAEATCAQRGYAFEWATRCSGFIVSPDGYVVTAELPGLRVDDIEITVERDRLTLRGERRIEHPEDASLHRVERQAGGFRRTIELPVDVDADKAQAVYRNGVLMLQIPKAAAHQPRQIAVESS